MKRLLVTGINGFVAGSVVMQAYKDWEIHGLYRSLPADFPERVITHRIDLTEKVMLEELFMRIQPDAVIHTAAIANIDFCENNQELAWKINAGITESIANLCKSAGVKLVACSTDTVFEGDKGFYTETDEPHAVNYYASTKIELERIVLAASPINVVARLALVMGLPIFGTGNSFLADMIEKLSKGESVTFPENETRTPIDVITLGAALLELAGNDFSGIIHLAGNTRINRYLMAVQIAETLGLNADLIRGTNSNALPGRAPRPNDASMVNDLAKKILKTPMLSLAEGLQLTLNFNKKENKI